LNAAELKSLKDLFILWKKQRRLWRICRSGYWTQQTSETEVVDCSNISTIEDEDEGLKRWDDMLANGQISNETYKLSMQRGAKFCVVHWNVLDQKFICQCGRKDCEFSND
jgi:hypothetical protein